MNPQCENFRQQIAEYIEACLTEDQLAQLERHLKTCPDCKEYFQACELDDKLLSDFAENMTGALTALSDGVIDQLNSHNHCHKSYHAIKHRILQYAAAAVILFAAGISLYIITNRENGEQLKIAHLHDGEDTTSVENSDFFVLDTDTRKQLSQIQKLIDSGQTGLLASVLDMPAATTHTKLMAAQFLASQNDTRGTHALEELTAGLINPDEQSGLTSTTYVADAFPKDKKDLMNSTRGPQDMLSEKGIFSTELVTDNSLDGKKAVVRIYDHWKNDPEVFRTVEVAINNRAVNFDSLKFDTDSNTAPVVAVFGPDQTDPNVAESLTNYVCASIYQKNLEFSLPGASYDKRSVVFNDASPDNAMFDAYGPISVGSPIPEADVKVYLVSNNKARICLGEYRTGSGGDIVVPYIGKHNNSDNRLAFFEFIVSQPDYGTAKVSNYLYPNGKSLPLVKSNSELALRAVRGSVVDPDGFPVAGADIYCSNVRTLGEGLIDSSDSNITVLTGEDGSFRLYILNRNRSNERGSLVPPKSTYHLRINAPAQTDLLPLQAALINDNEHIVTMNRGDVLRYFAFYDEEGLITDPDKLQGLNIYVRTPEGFEEYVLYYNDIKDGAFVPYGTYRAVIYDKHETEFAPVEVTPDSDEFLVFELPDVLEYCGRVVNGITGEPMKDIFVFAENGGKQKSLADLTDQDWDLLHFGDPDSDTMLFAPLGECYDIKQIVRTNANGEFTMWFRKGDAYGIIAAEQYFLPVMQRDMNLAVDEENRCEVPTLKLFPAAKLVFKLAAENPAEAYKEDMTVRGGVFFSGDVPYVNLQVWPWWSISPAGNPTWIPALLQCDNRQDKFIEYARWMRSSEDQCSIFVPADTKLTVKLDPSNDALGSMYLNVHPLQQGQIENIGEVSFSSRFQIAIKITDSQGNPCEGVPLRHKVDVNGWGIAHNSDEDGLVFFYVDPQLINTFGIHYYGDGQTHIETIDIDITTKEKAPKEFIMEVSDEMLQLLFG